MIDCFVLHNTPNCDNLCCSNYVCSFNPICCRNEWNLQCITSAIKLCPSNCELVNNSCFDFNLTNSPIWNITTIPNFNITKIPEQTSDTEIITFPVETTVPVSTNNNSNNQDTNVSPNNAVAIKQKLMLTLIFIGLLV